MAKKKSTMTDKELIKELEGKIEKLTNILDNILDKPKMLAKVAEGPFTSKEMDYYRVDIGGGSLIVKNAGNVIFGNGEKLPVQVGTEVLILEGAIVDIVPEVLKAKEKVKNTFKLISWNDIGGLKSQIHKIKEAIETPMNNADLAKEYGLEPIKGILLYGPPGCGKTLVAKAIASTILRDTEGDEGSFVYIKGAELLSMYVGATEQRIIQLFKSCREYAEKTGKKSVIFIDEAEAILPARGSRRSSDVEKTIVPTFLSEMDGFDEGSPIIILSTNLPNEIDSAVLRAGRIDLKIEVGRPTAEDTEEIFGVHLAKVKCSDDIKELAKVGTGYIFSGDRKKTVSGAMVQAAVKMATSEALTRKINNPKTGHPGVTVSDIMKAIDVI